MPKSLLFFSWIVLNSFLSLSQTLKITDSLNVPIPNSKVVVRDINLQLISIYTSSNDGYVNDIENIGYNNLIISHLGYETKEIIKPQLSKVDTVYIRLNKQLEFLNAIEIKAQKLISKNGDTVSIRLPYFKNHNDKSFTKVLKRIPGMEVTRNGEIKYKGKNITDLLINGQKLFDRDYNSAIAVLNPDQMLEIKIIDNFQDNNGFIKKKNNDVALDINYNSKLIISGNVDFSKGLRNQTDINLSNLVAISKVSNFFSTGFQNTGKSYLSQRLNAEQTSDFSLYGKTYIYPVTDKLQTNLDDYDTAINDSYNIDNNIRVDLGKKESLLIKAKNFWETIERENEISTLFLNESSNETRNLNTFRTVTSKNNLINIQYSKESENHFFTLESYFTRSNYDLNEESSLNGSEILFDRIQDELKIFLDGTYQYKWSDNNVTEFKISGVRGESNLNTLLINESLIFNQTNFTDTNFNLEMNQPLFKHNQWESKIKANSLFSNYNTGQALNNNDTSEIQTEEELRLLQTSANIKYQTRKLSIEALIGINYFSAKKDLLSSQNNFRPNISLSLNHTSLKWVQSLTSSFESYWLKQEFNVLTPLRTGISSVIQSNFINEPVNETRINYSISNIDLLRNYSFGFNFNSVDKALVNFTDFSADNSIIIFSPLSERINSYSFNANTTQYVDLLKSNLVLNTSASLGENYFAINESDIQKNQYSNFFSKITLKKRINKRIYASIYYKSNYIEFEYRNSIRTNYTYSSGAYIDINTTNLSIQINGGLENFGREKSYYLIDNTVSYSLSDSRWQFYCKGMNILNIKSIDDRNIDQFSITTQSVNIQGVRLLFGASYSF